MFFFRDNNYGSFGLWKGFYDLTDIKEHILMQARLRYRYEEIDISEINEYLSHMEIHSTQKVLPTSLNWSEEISSELQKDREEWKKVQEEQERQTYLGLKKKFEKHPSKKKKEKV